MKSKVKLIALIAIIGLSMTACAGGDNPAHTCSFGSWTKLSDATCVAKETQERACSSCVKTETREIGEFDPDAHDWDNYEGTEPSCLVDGEGTATCKLCGDVDDIIKPKLGHSFTEYTSNDNAT